MVPARNDCDGAGGGCCHERPLGPFQAIWDAWSPAKERIMRQREDYFEQIILLQLDEISAVAIEATTTDASESCVKEVIDIISVSLNWLRWFGLNDEDIAVAAKKRSGRYTKPHDIMNTYQQRVKSGSEVVGGDG